MIKSKIFYEGDFIISGIAFINSKMTYYMATCVPGGEDILLNEAREVMQGSVTHHKETGKIFFNAVENCGGTANPTANFFKLRCADNIYKILTTFEIGPHKEHLAILRGELIRLAGNSDFMPSLLAGTPRLSAAPRKSRSGNTRLPLPAAGRARPAF